MCGQSELDLRQEGRLGDEFGGHGRQGLQIARLRLRSIGCRRNRETR